VFVNKAETTVKQAGTTLVKAGSSRKEVTVLYKTKDIVVIGWINPNLVTVSSAGIDSELLALCPPDGKSFGISSYDTQLFLMRLSLGNAILTDNRYPLNGSPYTPIRQMDRTERAYVLNWLFKYSGNWEPPPKYFSNERELADFFNTSTRYKLYNHLTAIFLENKLYEIRHKADVGTTILPFSVPFRGNRVKGVRLPNNNTIELYDRKVHLINRGNPDEDGVKTFDTLLNDVSRKWQPIGSTIIQSIDDPGNTTVEMENYPTYYVYEREVVAGFDGPFLLNTEKCRNQELDPMDHTIKF